MSKNNIFTMNSRFTTAPGSVELETFYIPNNNRQFLIKSINWDFSIYDFATGAPIPFAQIVNQNVALAFGDVSSTPIGRSFSDIVPPPTSIGLVSGVLLVLYKPSFIEFDSFIFSNKTKIEVNVNNVDPLMNIAISYSITVEIKDLK